MIYEKVLPLKDITAKTEEEVIAEQIERLNLIAKEKKEAKKNKNQKISSEIEPTVQPVISTEVQNIKFGIDKEVQEEFKTKTYRNHEESNTNINSFIPLKAAYLEKTTLYFCLERKLNEKKGTIYKPQLLFQEGNEVKKANIYDLNNQHKENIFAIACYELLTNNNLAPEDKILDKTINTINKFRIKKGESKPKDYNSDVKTAVNF